MQTITNTALTAQVRYRYNPIAALIRWILGR